MNSSYSALRAETSSQTSRFAPYPNQSRSQSLYSNTLFQPQQFFVHPPTISALQTDTDLNPWDIAPPQSVDLTTPLTNYTTPATLEEFLAPIPTRPSLGASKGNTHVTATSSGTVFAAPIEPVVSNCSCSGSCSCVLCSGSNLEKVLMSASLGTEPDNCQSCTDCFDCKSLLNDLPQLAPLRDASIAAPEALQTIPVLQSGVHLQTDVQQQPDTSSPFTIKPNRHKEVSPDWSVAPDPDMLSALHNDQLFASSEADLANSAWTNYLLSAPLDNLWPVNGNSDEPAPTRAQSNNTAAVAQGPSFNGSFNEAYHYAS